MSAPIRKKVSPQIRDLVERNVTSRERSMYVIVGDNGRDQVVNLHYMLSKLTGKKPNVLWCYKKELGFSSHQKKRHQEVKKGVKSGLRDANVDEPFDMFQKTTDIRYCFYRDSEQVLGKTFSMCVLQDFEALTPNILCRTIETVEGGGIIVILLRTMSSLRQLYSVAMDMHKKYRSEDEAGGSESGFEPRFNERFILSLGQSKNCIVMDDEMNILPISTATLASLGEPVDSEAVGSKEESFEQVSRLASTIKPVGDVVVNMSKTADQANAVLQFTQTLSSASSASSTSSIRRLVCLTSGRGRGKSAALGMAIGSAVAFGYSNIVVTAPSIENVTTLFEFVTRTLEALQYKPHIDYVEITRRVEDKGGNDKMQSIYSTQKGNRKTREIPTQIIINKNNHRQTVQFLAADECHVGSAEILVIDEAAAIPLPKVKAMIASGNHLTLMSSTVHGYEGTGRALSLKLVQEIKRNPSFVVSELEMKTPIRYCLNDGIEKWLHNLLCLDSTEAPALKNKLVAPSDCKLYLVNRDALFSHHKATEKFLRNVVSLFVSSHYKNSPDDLMLMSDAPKHHVLALIPPVGEEDAAVPEVYVAIQIALEGRIGSKEEMFAKTAGALRPSGDMIPWTLSQQFSDTDFGQLNGVRIVRIAVHPSLARMGYGSEAIKQISAWIDSINSGNTLPQAVSLQETTESLQPEETSSLAMEKLKPRKLKKPLLASIDEPETCQVVLSNSGSRSYIDFLGTSFGLTLNLFNFWRKNGFAPLYLRQCQNETTGEFTCMMLKASDQEWLMSLYADFSLRFQRLLSGPFRSLSSELALSIISCDAPKVNEVDVVQFMSLYDLKRLRAYARGESDYHLITDLVPIIAELIFNGKLTISGNLTFLARRVLVGMGCQRKSIDEIYEEDKQRITIPQILGIFKPSIDKISAQIEKKLEAKIKSQFNERKNKNLNVMKTVLTPSGPMVIDTHADTNLPTEAQPETPSTEPEVGKDSNKKTLDREGSQLKKKQKVENK
ncbi:N-acetyltransferase [Perkinsus sp. BL_2016]|nr:N-acetyltransferase [Perkinsus sp. BL_2016]